MNIVDLIIKKRDGYSLSPEEISFFVKGVTEDALPDYQVSAMLMAIVLKGLDGVETANLTMAMAHSGDVFDLSQIPGIKVDKHSTGGVADTTTLILAPLVAACGVPVVKMSGRGLGFTGGTIDKLESIPGFNTDLTEQEALRFVQKSGIVIMGQTKNLTPADKKLYALRDVTGTVDSIPLIASSIMSKKISAGADGIVLDVKCGSGAFMKDLSQARLLAAEMVHIGKNVGRSVRAVISSMAEPLGSHIGNTLEVLEAIEVLKGNLKGPLYEVSLRLGAHMLILAQKTQNLEDGVALLAQKIVSGEGIEKFRTLIIQQGGNPDVIDHYNLFDQPKASLSVKASASGVITGMDAALIGRASVETGAGRLTKLDSLDFAAGIVMKKRLGNAVESGEELAVLYASSESRCRRAAALLNKAITIGDQAPANIPLVLDEIES